MESVAGKAPKGPTKVNSASPTALTVSSRISPSSLLAHVAESTSATSTNSLAGSTTSESSTEHPTESVNVKGYVPGTRKGRNRLSAAPSTVMS